MPSGLFAVYAARLALGLLSFCLVSELFLLWLACWGRLGKDSATRAVFL